MTQKQILNSLVLQRFVIRLELRKYNSLGAELRGLKRHRRKLEDKGVLFPLLDKCIEKLQFDSKVSRKTIAGLGEIIFHALDMWQEAGATFRDLCNLCNRPYELAVKEVGPDEIGGEFSSIVFVHHLDAKPTGRGWLDSEDDAPLTHALIEYMCMQLKTNSAAKQAAREGLEMFFPEIMENARYPFTDEDGETRFFDKDGVEIDAQELL